MLNLLKESSKKSPYQYKFSREVPASAKNEEGKEEEEERIRGLHLSIPSPSSPTQIKLVLEKRFWVGLVITAGLYLFSTETGNEWLYFLSALSFSVLALGFFIPLLQVLETDLHFNLPKESVSNERLDLRVKLTRKNWWGPLARLFPIQWLLIKIDLERLGEKENMLKPILVENLIREAWVIAQTPKLKRGLYNLRAIQMMSCYPFGLAWWVKSYPLKSSKLSARFTEEDHDLKTNQTNISAITSAWQMNEAFPQMIVFPRTDNIAGNFLYRLRAVGEHALFFSSSRPMAALSSASVRSLREFRTGDSPRFIHWPSSAKAGKLMIREFESEGLPAFDIVLDLTADWKSEEQFELAVSTTLSLLQLGYRLGGSPELFIVPSLDEDLEKLPSVFTNLPPVAPGIGWASQILARVEALVVKEADYNVVIPNVGGNNALALLTVRPCETIVPDASFNPQSLNAQTINDYTQSLKAVDIWVLSRLALEMASNSNAEAGNKAPIPLHAQGSGDRRAGESSVARASGRVLASIAQFEEMIHL